MIKNNSGLRFTHTGIVFYQSVSSDICTETLYFVPQYRTYTDIFVFMLNQH